MVIRSAGKIYGGELVSASSRIVKLAGCGLELFALAPRFLLEIL